MVSNRMAFLGAMKIIRSILVRIVRRCIVLSDTIFVRVRSRCKDENANLMTIIQLNSTRSYR